MKSIDSNQYGVAALHARVPRVLIGDSEAWSLELFKRACDAFGAELVVAKNGVEVLELFKTSAPSLVVLDTLLPKLDGLQAAARIRETELGRITPVVVTSALYRPGEDAERLQRKFGFTEFLPKPFRIDDLSSLLEQYLREEAERAAPDTDLYEDGVPLPAADSAEQQLGEMGVPALLCQLFRGRRSGTLTLRRGEITKVVFFEQGHITHARSNSKRDRLGRILLRSRRITLEDYERARRLQTDASGHLQLGAALVQLGVLGDNDVANAVVSQILSVLFSLFEWDSGTWSFLDSTSIPAEYSRFNFNTANLIFWGLRQLEGRREFSRFLPNRRVMLERPVDVQRFKDQLNLTYLEEQVLSLVDGRKRLGEILTLGKLARVDVERVVFSLLVLGVLRAVTDAMPAEPSISGQIRAAAEVDAKGTLLATSVARLLSRLHLGGHSGVLNLRRPGMQTTVHFEAGEIVHARSDQHEHALGEILLRSGTIAAADHERAVARMEPGRDHHIGTILLEMRAVSLEELHGALRLQVQDIVLDLFRWREGEFVYDAGVAPPELVISLPATTPNLIMEGTRLAEAPPGVLALLGQPDILFAKLWGDDRVLQQLRLTAAETRLLSLVGSGRPASEIGAMGLMPEAELGRALHGLLALEVIKAASGAAAAGHGAAHPDSDAAADALAEEDTPLPPTGALFGPFPGGLARPGLGLPAMAPLDRVRAGVSGPPPVNESAQPAAETLELRETVERLRGEIATLKQVFSRYFDIREGEGAGARFIAEALGQHQPRASVPAAGSKPGSGSRSEQS